MMQDEEVGLCFLLPGNGEKHYLVPEALPASPTIPPEWPADSLRFRYRYEFLPRGLVPRFIVQAHDLLVNEGARWRTGAVFEVRDCEILVEADVDQDRLDIQVRGPVNRRREALGVIRDRLESVHKQNREAAPTALVPLPDDPDNHEAYEHLLTMEDEEGPEYRHRPTGAKQSYVVSELLNGVRERPARNEAKSDSKSDWWSKLLESRRASAMGCGLLAAALAILLYVIPSPNFRWIVGLGVVAFVLVYSWMVRDKTKRLYQRLIGLTVVSGLAIAASGIALDGTVNSDWIFGSLRWDSNVNPLFFLCWVLALGVLVWAERKHSHSQQPR